MFGRPISGVSAASCSRAAIIATVAKSSSDFPTSSRAPFCSPYLGMVLRSGRKMTCPLFVRAVVAFRGPWRAQACGLGNDRSHQMFSVPPSDVHSPVASGTAPCPPLAFAVACDSPDSFGVDTTPTPGAPVPRFSARMADRAETSRARRPFDQVGRHRRARD